MHPLFERFHVLDVGFLCLADLGYIFWMLILIAERILVYFTVLAVECWAVSEQG
jgi:hypothetical protein